MYYVGIDGHKDTAVICVQTRSGNITMTFSTTADYAGMDELIERMDGKKYKVLAETSTYTIDLHDYLVSKRIESYLAHPTQLKLITESNKKTDRNDSETLASYLRLWDKGELGLSISFIVRDDERKLRDLCRYREGLAKSKGRIMQNIKSHTRINAQYYDGDYSTKKAERYFRENHGDDYVLMCLWDDYVYLDRKADDIDRKFEEFAKNDEDVQLLKSIPGIGTTTAVELKSMIVDVDRFPTADHARSYYGTAPRVRDSGGSVKHGHITRNGDPMMRDVLSRTVNTHRRYAKDEHISVYWDSHRPCLGGGKTMVACMNKLLDLIIAVLKRRTPYVRRSTSHASE